MRDPESGGPAGPASLLTSLIERRKPAGPPWNPVDVSHRGPAQVPHADADQRLNRAGTAGVRDLRDGKDCGPAARSTAITGPRSASPAAVDARTCVCWAAGHDAAREVSPLRSASGPRRRLRPAGARPARARPGADPRGGRTDSDGGASGAVASTKAVARPHEAVAAFGGSDGELGSRLDGSGSDASASHAADRHERAGADRRRAHHGGARASPAGDARGHRGDPAAERQPGAGPEPAAGQRRASHDPAAATGPDRRRAATPPGCWQCPVGRGAPAPGTRSARSASDRAATASSGAPASR